MEGMGELHVEVLRARELPIGILGGGESTPKSASLSSNCFAVLHFEKQEFKSKTVPRGESKDTAIWNESFHFAVSKPDSSLQITVWDKKLVAANGFLGQVTVPLKKLRDQQEHKRWYHLLSKDGEITIGGMIELRLEWIFSELHSFMGAFTSEEEEQMDDDDDVSQYGDSILVKRRQILKLKNNVIRSLYFMLPILRGIILVRDLIDWKDFAISALSLATFLWVSYNSQYVAAACGVMIAYAIRHKPGPTPPKEKEKKEKTLEEMKREIEATISQLRAKNKGDFDRILGATVNLSDRTVLYLQHLKDLMKWKDKVETKRLMLGLAAFAVVFYFVPVFRISLYLFEWLVFLSGLYVMTLRALYIKFPQLEKRGYHHNDIIRRAYQKYVSHVSVPSAATSPNVSTPPSVVSSTRSSAAVSPRNSVPRSKFGRTKVLKSTLTEPTKTGFLLKQPNPMKLQRTWKNLYFILHEGVLYYFKDETASEASGALVLAQMTGSFVEVKSRVCFSLHNEVTNKNFVISSEETTLLDEWVNLIESHLGNYIQNLQQQVSKALEDLPSSPSDRVIWNIVDETLAAGKTKDYSFPIEPGRYMFEFEKSDKIPGPTRLVTAVVTLKNKDTVIQTLKTGKVGQLFRYTPEEFQVPDDNCTLSIHVETTSFLTSLRFTARLVKKGDIDPSTKTKQS